MVEVEADFTSCCQWARCRQTDIAIVWGGIGLCDPHWQKVAVMDGLVIDNLWEHVSKRAQKELRRILGAVITRSLKSMFGL